MSMHPDTYHRCRRYAESIEEGLGALVMAVASSPRNPAENIILAHLQDAQLKLTKAVAKFNEGAQPATRETPT